ncbi:unnamed protein product [Trichogramma brassicae]|uniref:RING-type domain-containing protein n=1 Tax=Trichogramma brassicae TaxID=86971 RepID=A0A6H5HXH3_9HYME|nr:unnamed protein product [Trichogramma brassicae]
MTDVANEKAFDLRNDFSSFAAMARTRRKQQHLSRAQQQQLRLQRYLDNLYGYADTLCRAGRLHEALTVYQHCFEYSVHHGAQQPPPPERLRHFAGALLEDLVPSMAEAAEAAAAAAHQQQRGSDPQQRRSPPAWASLACPSCETALYHPVTLDCGHTYCKPCLRLEDNGQDRRRGRKPRCKLCSESRRTATASAYGGVVGAGAVFDDDDYDYVDDDDVSSSNSNNGCNEINVLVQRLAEKWWPREVEASQARHEGDALLKKGLIQQAFERYDLAVQLGVHRTQITRRARRDQRQWQAVQQQQLSFLELVARVSTRLACILCFESSSSSSSSSKLYKVLHESTDCDCTTTTTTPYDEHMYVCLCHKTRATRVKIQLYLKNTRPSKITIASTGYIIFYHENFSSPRVFDRFSRIRVKVIARHSRAVYSSCTCRMRAHDSVFFFQRNRHHPCRDRDVRNIHRYRGQKSKRQLNVARLSATRSNSFPLVRFIASSLHVSDHRARRYSSVKYVYIWRLASKYITREISLVKRETITRMDIDNRRILEKNAGGTRVNRPRTRRTTICTTAAAAAAAAEQRYLETDRSPLLPRENKRQMAELPIDSLASLENYRRTVQSVSVAGRTHCCCSTGRKLRSTTPIAHSDCDRTGARVSTSEAWPYRRCANTTRHWWCWPRAPYSTKTRTERGTSSRGHCTERYWTTRSRASAPGTRNSCSVSRGRWAVTDRSTIPIVARRCIISVIGSVSTLSILIVIVIIARSPPRSTTRRPTARTTTAAARTTSNNRIGIVALGNSPTATERRLGRRRLGLHTLLQAPLDARDNPVRTHLLLDLPGPLPRLLVRLSALHDFPGRREFYLANSQKSVTDFVEKALLCVAPQEYAARSAAQRQELVQPLPPALSQVGEQVAVFVCTTAFPCTACPLFVYEPRYRLMVRRCLESGVRQFGIAACLQRRPDGYLDLDARRYAEFGTMLEIKDRVLLKDGCSILSTVGMKRFRVLRGGERDGYDTAEVEFISDVPISQEQMHSVTELHKRVRAKSSRWWATVPYCQRSEIRPVFGEFPDVEADWQRLPDGPSWTWWLLAILPLGPQLQIGILATTSLEKRLRAIEKTIDHMEQRWNLPSDLEDSDGDAAKQQENNSQDDQDDGSGVCRGNHCMIRRSRHVDGHQRRSLRSRLTQIFNSNEVWEVFFKKFDRTYEMKAMEKDPSINKNFRKLVKEQYLRTATKKQLDSMEKRTFKLGKAKKEVRQQQQTPRSVSAANLLKQKLELDTAKAEEVVQLAPPEKPKISELIKNPLKLADLMRGVNQKKARPEKREFSFVKSQDFSSKYAGGEAASLRDSKVSISPTKSSKPAAKSAKAKTTDDILNDEEIVVQKKQLKSMLTMGQLDDIKSQFQNEKNLVLRSPRSMIIKKPEKIAEEEPSNNNKAAIKSVKKSEKKKTKSSSKSRSSKNPSSLDAKSLRSANALNDDDDLDETGMSFLMKRYLEASSEASKKLVDCERLAHETKSTGIQADRPKAINNNLGTSKFSLQSSGTAKTAKTTTTTKKSSQSRLSNPTISSALKTKFSRK